MIAWLRKQNATVIGMLIIAIMLLIGIILRWDYISHEAASSFKGLFEKPDSTQVITPSGK